MQKNKSLVQEALIQMKQVEEAIAENAKGILASTMKEEINQLVKESLSEQDDENEIDLDSDVDIDVDDKAHNADVDIDMDTDNEDDMDVDTDTHIDSDEESPIDLTHEDDDTILKVFKAMSEKDGIIIKKDGDDIHLTDNDADTEYLVKLGESEEDEQINMDEMNHMNYDEQDESIDDIIDAIFSPNGNTSKVDVNDLKKDVDSDDEEVVYEIEFDEQDEEMDEQNWQEEMDEQNWQEDMDEQDEEMDEQDEEMDEQDNLDESINQKKSQKKIKPKGVGIGSGPKFSYKKGNFKGFSEDKKEAPKAMGTGKAQFEYKKGPNAEGNAKKVETKEAFGGKKGDDSKSHKDYEKSETKEAARTFGSGSKEGRGLRKGITNNRNYVYSNSGVKVESLENEVSTLREKNEEYRKALNVFREKLNEVAIFNSNLAYATRLFTEHSTTKKEKINILRRFDGVETLKESKYLYKSIKDELSKSDTKSINESVENKLNKHVSTGSSSTLIESKTYENPQFLRMKDLMSKMG